MQLNIFTSSQVAAWLVAEAKKYREARQSVEYSKDELDVLFGAEHVLFTAAKFLYYNIGIDFTNALQDKGFTEDVAKSINLIIGKADKIDGYVNSEVEVLKYISQMAYGEYLHYIEKEGDPYKMGRCAAIARFIDDLCFQLDLDTITQLEYSGIPLEFVYKICGYVVVNDGNV